MGSLPSSMYHVTASCKRPILEDTIYSKECSISVDEHYTIVQFRYLFLFAHIIPFCFADFVEDKKPIRTGSKENPLVAISSITAGGIIMGFVIAFVAYRLCRNKRNTEEPFFGKSSCN